MALAGFWVAAYLAKKYPSSMMGESGQSLPFLRLPKAPGGEGGEGESPSAGKEEGVNARGCSEPQG